MNRQVISLIAWRYLRGKGTANAVPILSRISMIAIAVSSCAMIILFSVFNGFESLVDDLYKAFYPELKITAVQGKFFDPQQVNRQVQKVKGIQSFSSVIEDNALVNTEEGETIPVCIKGVDDQYGQVNDLAAYINKGNDTLLERPLPTAILGQHIAATLGVDVDNVFARMMVYYPNANATLSDLNPTNAFQSVLMKPDATFMVQEEFDGKYIVAPIAAVQELMRQGQRVSSVEIKVAPGYAPEAIQADLQAQLGQAYNIATRYQQNKAVYMVMRSEKWAGYAILLFVLLIASFNMVSALSLLVLEKQKDMGILRTMGILPAMLTKIILLEGLLWSLVGGLIGLLSGVLLCYAQIQFKLVRIPGAFIIDAFPIVLHYTDVLVVLATVSCVGLLAAWYPAKRAGRQSLSAIMSGK
jgi:lipoprotein-releasing system permease protein